MMNHLRLLLRKNQLLLWLPPLLVYAGISYLSSLPNPPQLIPQFFLLDKFEHFAAYFVFGFLIARSVLWDLTWHPDWSKRLNLILFVVLLLAGAIDEFHQSFVPNRMVEFADWVADTWGAFTGYYLGKFVYKQRIPKKISKEVYCDSEF